MPNEVSLCMIVRDEEENLKRCLESVKDVVDEIIIVDTGSTDNTVEIAKSYGAKVYYFQWCNDFSAARNETLKYASKDWILILDADDELCGEDKDKLRALLNSGLDENVVYFFETLNYFGSTIDSSNITINLNPRLFKNNHGYFYQGKVHNQLVGSTDELEGAVCPIKIYHYGYLEKYIHSKDKRKRNIALLEDQIKTEPDKKYACFNLGNEYFALNDKRKALEYYYKAFEDFDPHVGYGSTLIIRIVISNYILKQYEDALEFINNGVKYYPDFTDLYFLKGLIYKEQNKPTLAINELKKCIELGDPPAELKFLYGTGGFRAFFELANVYMEYKDIDIAYKFYIETIRAKPDFLVPLYNITRILKERETPVEEFKKIIENFFTEFPKAYPIIADLFYSEGYFETALEYIEKCIDAKLFSENLLIFKVKCLARTGRFDECIKIDTACANKQLQLQLNMYKAISLIMADKYTLARALIDQLDDSSLHVFQKKMIEVYKQLVNLFTNTPARILSEDADERYYTQFIFEILEIFLANRLFDKHEKALNLLNLISDKSVLLQLGKLYYKYGYVETAKKEIIRSVKTFEAIDDEGIDILKEANR